METGTARPDALVCVAPRRAACAEREQAGK